MLIIVNKIILIYDRHKLLKLFYYLIMVFVMMNIVSHYYVALGQETNDIILEENNSYDFPIKQILFIKKSNPDIRKIFLLIEDPYFKRENLEKVFVGLSIKYKSPTFLTIVAYSNETIVQRAYKYEQRGSVHYPNTLEGLEQAAKDSPEGSLTPVGFFRAYYYRYHEEFFDYTPNKDEANLVRVELKPSIQLPTPPAQEENTIYSQLLPLIMNDDLTEFNQLLFDVSNVNIKDEVGNTLLMWAARWGKKNVVEILIKKGTDLEAQDVSGNNALMLASYGGHTETVGVLIKYGAKVNVIDKRGETALIGAAKHNQPSVIQVLLKARADVNVKNKKGATVLMLASDNSLIIEKLLKAGADKEAKDNDGRTALFYAVEKEYANKLKSLLKAGASVNVKDNDGITPLDLAEQYQDSPNSSKIISLLKQAGAK